MKKKVKIWWFFLFPVLLFTAILFAVQFHFEKIVKNIIVTEVNKKLLVKASASEIRFSVWENFPKASLSFKNIRINSPDQPVPAKPFISKGNLSLSFNLVDLITGNYSIEQISISSAVVNVFPLDSLNYNYNIWKKEPQVESKNEVAFRINKIIIIESRINFHSFQNEEIIEASVIKAEIKGKNANDQMSLSGNLSGTAHQILFAKRVFHEIDFNWEGNFLSSKNNFSIKTEELALLQGQLTAEGLITGSPSGVKLELELNSHHLELEKVKQKMNSIWPTGLNNYSISGELNSSNQITGYTDKPEGLQISSRFNFEKGSFSLVEKNQGAKKINLDGTFNGMSGKESTFQLKINKISASVNGQEILGRASYSGKNPNVLQSHVEGMFDMEKLSEFVSLDSIGSFKGNVIFSLDGNIPLLKENNKDINRWEINGELQANKLQYQNPDNSVNISDIAGQIKMEGKNAKISNLYLSYRESKIKISGTIEDWKSIGNQEKFPHFRGNISCQQVDIDKLFTRQNSKTDNSSSDWGIPFTISAGISAEKINYNSLNLSALKTRLTINPNQIVFDSLRVEGLKGTAAGNIQLLTKSNGEFKCKIYGNLSRIDITELFKSFDNFEQKTLRHDHISGNLNAEINFAADYDRENNIILNSIRSMADLKISNGRLQNFSPLYSLSKYISIEELNDITFSELNNTVKIENSRIEFPQMEIQSSAININVNGIHYFSNKIDYHFSILLNELLNKKFNRKNKDRDEFGVFEESEETNNREIFIHLTGTVDKPEFSIDKSAMKKSRKEKWNEEKKTIQNLIKTGGREMENQKANSFDKSEKMFTLENDEKEIIPEKNKKEKKENLLKKSTIETPAKKIIQTDKPEKKKKKEKTENSDDFN